MFKHYRFLPAHDGYHSSSLDVLLIGVAVMFCALFVSVSRYKPQSFPAMTNEVQFQNNFGTTLTAGKTNVVR